MGEVYRAEDTKLGREVAIKVLPEAVAADPERLARFEREAKVLASLNHPNIAGIHQVEEAEGQHFLVMELVEGEDLQERIARGPMPIDETLPVALQIAEALEAAHGQGVIHRDLKPANVKLTPDHKVKVLDFGLAKALDGSADAKSISGAGNLLSMSPTLTAQMTQAGVILGTASYMSPEQARGADVDRRADIWAFGVLLFEMLTGQKTFDGRTVTDVIAAVVTRDPDWTALPQGTPSASRSAEETVRDPHVPFAIHGVSRRQICLCSVLPAGACRPRCRCCRGLDPDAVSVGAEVERACNSLLRPAWGQDSFAGLSSTTVRFSRRGRSLRTRARP